MRIRLFFAGQTDPGLLDISSPVVMLILNVAPTFTFDRAGLLQGFPYRLVGYLKTLATFFRSRDLHFFF